MRHRITAITTALILTLSLQGQVLSVRAYETDNAEAASAAAYEQAEAESAPYSLLDEDFPDEDSSIVVANGDEVFAACEEVNPAYVDVEPPTDISLSITPEEELLIQEMQQAADGQADFTETDDSIADPAGQGTSDDLSTHSDQDSDDSFASAKAFRSGIFAAGIQDATGAADISDAASPEDSETAATFNDGEEQACTTYDEARPVIVSAFQSRSDEIIVQVNIRTGAEFEDEYKAIEADDTLTTGQKWDRKYAIFYRYMWRTALSHDPAQPAAGDYLAYQYGGYSVFYEGTNDTADGTALFKGKLTYRMYNYKTEADKEADIRSSRYYTDAAQEAAVTAAIGPVLDSIITEDMTDRQKIAAIHDYICKNVSYGGSNDNYIKYTAYGALINKLCVCQGYSSLFYRMALMEGIDCRVISGYGKLSGSGGNHAWNCLKLGEVYYLCDSTWDAKKASYSWLLKGEDDFAGHVANHKNEKVKINDKETGARPNFFREEDYPIDALNWDDDESMADYFTLSFSGNGATGGTVPEARTLTRQQTTAAIRAKTIIKGYIDTCDLTRNGFLFDSWNSAPDGSGKKYAPGVPVSELPGLDESVKAPASEDDLKMTLYARWIPLWGDVTEADRAQFASYDEFMAARATEPVWIAPLPSKASKPDMYVYSGQPLTWGSSVHVYDVKKRLVLGTDYDLTYENNINAGPASVTVVFKGNNEGEKTLNWDIESADISGDGFRIEGTSKKSDGTAYIHAVANGSAQKPKVYLYRGGTLLFEDTDYTLSAAGACIEPGTYTLTLTGKGNYTGTRNIDLIIEEAVVPSPSVEIENVSADTFRVSGFKKKLTYTKEGVRQTKMTVIDRDGTELTEGVDYKLTYNWPADAEGNLISGTAQVTIEGTGAAKSVEYAVDGKMKRYIGTKVLSFTVKAVPLSSVSMSGFVKSFAYDGNEHAQDFSENGVKLITASGSVLEEGIDFNVTYKPESPVKAGKVTMKITGRGGFSGKLTKKYTITKRSISGSSLMVSIPNENDVEEGPDGFFYRKGGTKPVPEAWIEGNPGDIELVKGKDFKVKYKKNKKTSGTAYYKITGKGNFKGSSGWQPFEILKRDLGDEELRVSVPVAKYSTKPGKSLVKPVIKDVNGKKLVKGKDYKIVRYSVYDPQTGETMAVSKEDTIPFDSVVNIEISAKSSSGYTGTRVISYRVVYYDIASAKVKLSPASFEYTGSPIRPLEITGTELVWDGTVLVEGTDFEVLCDDNIDAGSYVMTLRGIGFYGGEKKLTYRITRRKIT